MDLYCSLHWSLHCFNEQLHILWHFYSSQSFQQTQFLICHRSLEYSKVLGGGEGSTPNPIQTAKHHPQLDFLNMRKLLPLLVHCSKSLRGLSCNVSGNEITKQFVQSLTMSSNGKYVKLVTKTFQIFLPFSQIITRCRSPPIGQTQQTTMEKYFTHHQKNISSSHHTLPTIISHPFHENMLLPAQIFSEWVVLCCESRLEK